jgi:hypothetical protein
MFPNVHSIFSLLRNVIEAVITLIFLFEPGKRLELTRRRHEAQDHDASMIRISTTKQPNGRRARNTRRVMSSWRKAFRNRRGSGMAILWHFAPGHAFTFQYNE